MKLVDTKDLKSLPLWECQFESGRGHQKKMDKNSILIIFKDKKKVTKNQDFWNDKFSKKYNTSHLYLYDYIHLPNKKISELINKKIIELDVGSVIFEGDHMSSIDYNFINYISKKVKKGIFLGDDSVWHQVNLITASACDFVLTDPVSSFKFNELGISSIFSSVEGNEDIFKDYKYEKTIDVLFFGRDKTDRKNYLEILDKNNIKYLSVNPYTEESNTIEKLAILINKSKIVINLTKSLNGKRFFNPSSKFKYGFYFKGRVIMSGLCNTLCVSEHAPSNDILYPNKELPTFRTKEEFLQIVKYYLNDEKKLSEDTKTFYKKSNEYSDVNYIETIYNFINNVNTDKKVRVKIPIWYYYIVISQHFRLRSKLKKYKSYIFQFFDNLTLPLYVLPINLIFFLRFLPTLIVKKIFNIN